MKNLIIVLVLCMSLSSFAGNEKPVQFRSVISNVNEQMLKPGFWTRLIKDADKIIMGPEKIKAYNSHSVRHCEKLVDLKKYRKAVSGRMLTTMISKVSKPSSRKRYFRGKEVTQHYYDGLSRNLNLAGIPELAVTRYGISVRRTEMRTFPTWDRIYSDPEDYEFDRLIETAIYPLEPMVILHESTDGKWYFAQCYNYLAWVPVKDVAITDRKSLYEYIEKDDFLVVTGKKVFTQYNPLEPDISELQLDMGIRIPLSDSSEIPNEICGQYPFGNYVVKLPVRNRDGLLEFRQGLISMADDVHIGYLPFTRANIINQAFKFLGQRYGWGGLFNARDCSAFIMDIYRTVGINIPRNSGEQGKLAAGIMHEFPKKMGITKRKRIFDSLPAATPVYLSGHAMLYIGRYNFDYYIIHDFSSLRVKDEKGNLVEQKARCVNVTPLLNTFLSSGKPYIEGLYSAREFVLEE